MMHAREIALHGSEGQLLRHALGHRHLKRAHAGKAVRVFVHLLCPCAVPDLPSRKSMRKSSSLTNLPASLVVSLQHSACGGKCLKPMWLVRWRRLLMSTSTAGTCKRPAPRCRCDYVLFYRTPCHCLHYTFSPAKLLAMLLTVPSCPEGCQLLRYISGRLGVVGFWV